MLGCLGPPVWALARGGGAWLEPGGSQAGIWTRDFFFIVLLKIFYFEYQPGPPWPWGEAAWLLGAPFLGPGLGGALAGAKGVPGWNLDSRLFIFFNFFNFLFFIFFNSSQGPSGPGGKGGA